MNIEIQSQFDRIEVALDTLIDSITYYNPSQAAALALVEADDDLSKGLERLSQHQSNHTTLLTLRETASSLDAQIKSTLSLLADTRNDLLKNTPLTAAPAQDDEQDDAQTEQTLQYAELLTYASRIAKFTVPPTRQRLIPDAGGTDWDDGAAGAGVAIKTEAPSPAVEPPQATLQPGTPPSTSTPVPAPAPEAPSHFQAANNGRAVDALEEHVRHWLDPTTSYAQFTPWPGDDVIRRGALGKIQTMIENGEDPESVVVNTTVEVGDTKGEMEGEQGAGDGAVHEVREQRRQAAARPRVEVREEGIVGFDLYDPDED